MIQFNVPDMTCGACANRIGRALTQAGLPAGLQVEIDVAARQVRVVQDGPGEVVRAVQTAIEQAGYTAQPKNRGGTPEAPGPSAGGCCCAARRAAAVDAGQDAPVENAGYCIR